MAALTELGEASFDQFLAETQKPVLVDFYAPWCGPCRAMAPTLEQMASDFGERIEFAKLNIDEAGALAARLGIRSIPALMLFVDGKPLDVRVGQRPRGELVQWLASNLIVDTTH